MFVTPDLLARKGACASEIARFKSLRPAGVEVTLSLCIEFAQEFDWDWAARRLLPAPLDADYKAKCAPLYADYEAKCAALDADYKAKCAPLYADYKAKCAALFGSLASAVEAIP